MSLAHQCKMAAERQQSGALAEARVLYRKVLLASPSHRDAVRGMAGVLAQLGETEELLRHLQKSVMRFPDDAVLICQLALAKEDLGRVDQARALFQKSLQKRPSFMPGYVHLASLELAAGRWTHAEETAQLGLLVDLHNVALHVILGQVARLMGRPQRARVYWERAIRLEPTCLDALQYLAALALEQQDHEEAWRYAMMMDALPTESALGLLVQGTVLLARQQYESAEEKLLVAICRDPNHAATWIQLGMARHAMDDLKGAELAFEQATLADPDAGLAWYNWARTLEEQGHLERAIPIFEQALVCNPERLSAMAGLLQCRRTRCDWVGLSEQEDQFIELIRDGVGSKNVDNVPLLLCAMVSDDRLLHVELAQQASELAKTISLKAEQVHAPARRLSGIPNRLKVAYLTYDCRDHPMAHLTVNVLESHDRNAVEVWCYSVGPDDRSAYRRRMQHAVDHFVDAHGWTDAALEQRIRLDGIHILVDLMGHTRGDRLGVLSRRPAPIQATWLGYPGTTGARYIDYLIADPIVVPETHRHQASESLAYLPVYQPNDSRAGWPQPIHRLALGLPERGVVLGCFCRTDKLDPVLFAAWMRILKRVDNAVLWLYVPDGSTRERLRSYAAEAGVSRTRLKFAERRPKNEHLARMGAADLILDTRLYNGHTTTSEALRAGVPVMTIMGNHFPSRVSASLLTAQGLEECIATSLADYEERVVSLCSNRVRLRTLQEKTRRAREEGKLFDTQDVVQHLEGLYKQMVRIQVEGRVARTIWWHDAD